MSRGVHAAKLFAAGWISGALTVGGIMGMARAHADGVFDICPSRHTGVVEGTPTSCPFADNVRSAWFSQPGNPVLVYSPVTGRIYSMTCVASNETVGGIRVGGWTCYGGNDAEVVIWP